MLDPAGVLQKTSSHLERTSSFLQTIEDLKIKFDRTFAVARQAVKNYANFNIVKAKFAFVSNLVIKHETTLLLQRTLKIHEFAYADKVNQCFSTNKYVFRNLELRMIKLTRQTTYGPYYPWPTTRQKRFLLRKKRRQSLNFRFLTFIFISKW